MSPVFGGASMRLPVPKRACRLRDDRRLHRPSARALLSGVLDLRPQEYERRAMEDTTLTAQIEQKQVRRVDIVVLVLLLGSLSPNVYLGLRNRRLQATIMGLQGVRLVPGIKVQPNRGPPHAILQSYEQVSDPLTYPWCGCRNL